MSPTSRRITLYWLLLLVPTLLVGAAAIHLLRREEQRIARQSEQAVEARRAAMEAQTRLVAENVELLIDDVQQGLLETLGAARGADVDAVLAEWRAVNPLVRGVFRATGEGGLLWPRSAEANEETRAFLRRAAELLQQHRPWQQPEPAAVTAAPAPTETQRKATANLAQVQSARRDVQQLLRSSDFAANSVASEDANEPARRGQVARAESERRARESGQSRAEKKAEARPAAATVAPRRAGLVPAASARASDAREFDPRGWTTLTNGNFRHLFGWVVLTDPDSDAKEIRGVELEIQALLIRLAGALPREIETGEVYELRDAAGRVIHRVGYREGGGEPNVRTAFSNPLFAGWEIAGYAPAPIPGSATAAFFWVATLLVAIFLAAILAGGALLMRQARRSETEALQKTSFVANVSHEFKTPLTTIRLYAELLEQGRVRDQAKAAEYLSTIGRETQRLARLVNNVLDFSRLEQGRKKFAPEPLELRNELTRLLDTHEVRLNEAGLTLTRRLPVEPVNLTTDRDALEQIVINLLDNAGKYAAPGGELIVTLESTSIPVREEGGASARLPGLVRLSVADRGPGVPAEHRERIFEKFHRVDETLTAEKAGAGLGLSIARQLARGLGGDLRYEDRTGGGAIFTLELPHASS